MEAHGASKGLPRCLGRPFRARNLGAWTAPRAVPWAEDRSPRWGWEARHFGWHGGVPIYREPVRERREPFAAAPNCALRRTRIPRSV